MSLLTISALRLRSKKGVPYNLSALSVLTEKMQKQASLSAHDIFLSHAFDDKELILGVALTLEDLGYTVYLDWRDDPSLDRRNVNETTAFKLRDRMRNSRCLFFATTEKSSNSRWMPWELGFKDGQSGRAAILPILDYLDTSFKGNEYLGLYPYVTQQKDTTGKDELWIRVSAKCYTLFSSWLRGVEPYPH